MPFKGINLLTFATDSLQPGYDQYTFPRLVDWGINRVAIIPVFYVNGMNGNDCYHKYDLNSMDMPQIEAWLVRAGQRGLKVYMRPFLFVDGGGWRGGIQPSNKAQFFRNYTNIINQYAEACERHKGVVEMLGIGHEQKSLEDSGQGNNDYWATMVNEAAARYSGIISYDINWDTRNPFWTSDPTGKFAKLGRYGVDMYYQVADHWGPSVEHVRQSWYTRNQYFGQSPRGHLQDIFNRSGGKRFYAGEWSCSTAQGSCKDPAAYADTPPGALGAVDEYEQETYVKALKLALFDDAPAGFDGGYWWGLTANGLWNTGMRQGILYGHRETNKHSPSPGFTLGGEAFKLIISSDAPAPTPTTPSLDLALNKPAIASSTEQAGREAGMAVDGNSGTRWASAYVDSATWQVDLGAEKQIDRIRINWEAAYAPNYTLESSLNGTTWTPIATVTLTAAGVKETTFTARQARHVRVTTTGRVAQGGTLYGVSFWDFNVYAPVATTDPGTSPTGKATTRPIGTAPLTDAQATAKVVRDPGFEPKPNNADENKKIPTAAELDAWRAADPARGDLRKNLITGNHGLGATATTDEIIQWAAHKWGIDEDLIRAVAVKESYWRMEAVGDLNTPGNESYGLTQVRRSTHAGTHPLSATSTGFNVDYFGWYFRFMFDGNAPYLGAGYVAGSEDVALNGWNRGVAQSPEGTAYVNEVRQNITEQEWRLPAFVDQAIVAPAVGDLMRGAGGTVTASSTETFGGTALSPELAVDGNPATRWGSAYADNQWWQRDFGANRTVGRVVIEWENAHPKRYTVSTSTDGTTWQIAADVTLGPSIGYVARFTRSHSFTPRAARYVRIDTFERATQYGVSMWSVEAYAEGAAIPTSGAVLPNGSVAGSSEALIDTICLNGHWFFNGGIYYENVARTTTILLDLGVRVVRDGHQGRRTDQAERLNYMADRGLGLCLIEDHRADPHFAPSTLNGLDGDYPQRHLKNEDGTDGAFLPEDDTRRSGIARHGALSLTERITDIKNGVIRGVRFLEGSNEYDTDYAFWDFAGAGGGGVGTGDTARAIYADQAATAQKKLRDLVNTHLAGTGIKVFGPSYTNWQAYESYRRAQVAIGGGVAMDAVNMHPYPGGKAPTGAGDGGTILWHRREEADRVMGVTDAPWAATETGYHTAVNQGGGHPPASERAKAIYVPKLLGEYYRQGSVLTALYELYDQWNDPEKDEQEGNFGDVRNDFSYKPSATALKNLIAIHHRSGPVRTGTLEHSVTADPEVQHMLTVRGDGTFALSFWQDVPVWNQTTKTDLFPPVSTAGVIFSVPRDVQRYHVGQGAAPLATSLATKVMTVEVPADDTVILIIKGDEAPVVTPLPVLSVVDGVLSWTQAGATDRYIVRTRAPGFADVVTQPLARLTYTPPAIPGVRGTYEVRTENSGIWSNAVTIDWPASPGGGGTDPGTGGGGGGGGGGGTTPPVPAPPKRPKKPKARLGRIPLANITDELTEQLGEDLDLDGGTVNAGEVAPRPFSPTIAVRAVDGDLDPLVGGAAVRRKLRALLDNTPARLEAPYFELTADPEQSGWIIPGRSELSYHEGGVTFQEYRLALQGAIRLGTLATHQPGLRLHTTHRRFRFAPRDRRQLLYSEDFKNAPTITIHAVPAGAQDISTTGTYGHPLLTLDRLGLNAEPVALLVEGQPDKTAITYEPSMTSPGLGDVVILDRRGRPNPAQTVAGDLDPETEYGWEEVYGPNQPLTRGDMPVLTNGACRLRLVNPGATGQPVFALDAPAITGGLYQELGRFTIGQFASGSGPYAMTRLVRAAVIGWTTERATIAVTLDAPGRPARTMAYFTLQRGWPGPRVELYSSENGQEWARPMFKWTARVPERAVVDCSNRSWDSTTGEWSGSGGPFVGAEPWVAISQPSEGARCVHLAVLQERLELYKGVDSVAYPGEAPHPSVELFPVPGFYQGPDYLSVHLGYGAGPAMVYSRRDTDLLGAGDLGAMAMVDARQQGIVVAR